MYQEACKAYILSGIIKDMKMKIDPRNKWRKANSVILDIKLNTSFYRGLMKSLTQARSIETCDFKILKYEIQSMMTWKLEFLSLQP